jgi:hypothetical protein
MVAAGQAFPGHDTGNGVDYGTKYKDRHAERGCDGLREMMTLRRPVG